MEFELSFEEAEPGAIAKNRVRYPSEADGKLPALDATN
jgi:hypothetical protein